MGRFKRFHLSWTAQKSPVNCCEGGEEHYGWLMETKGSEDMNEAKATRHRQIHMLSPTSSSLSQHERAITIQFTSVMWH